MAEKEERIKIGYQSENLDVITEYTRQEAIERIEKVLEEGWWSGKTFRQLSEAALNALLEADK